MATTFAPGEVVYCLRSGEPYFARVEVLLPSLPAPAIGWMRVRFIDEIPCPPPNGTADVKMRDRWPDSPELRAWWQARVEAGRLARRLSDSVKRRGLSWHDRAAIDALPEARADLSAWRHAKQLEAICRRSHPLNRRGL
jgi:hypothetical protein